MRRRRRCRHCRRRIANPPPPDGRRSSQRPSSSIRAPIRRITCGHLSNELPTPQHFAPAPALRRRCLGPRRRLDCAVAGVPPPVLRTAAAVGGGPRARAPWRVAGPRKRRVRRRPCRARSPPRGVGCRRGWKRHTSTHFRRGKCHPQGQQPRIVRPLSLSVRIVYVCVSVCENFTRKLILWILV